MNILQSRRINVAKQNATSLLSTYADVMSTNRQMAMSRAVTRRLNPEIVVNQSDQIIVTEVGFVTMAVLVGHAVYRKDLLLIPGVDDKNQFGYLVLRNGFVPYHSLAQDIDIAVNDTIGAHNNVHDLIGYYGSKASLKKAAADAPWYLWSNLDDAREAGMCHWGSMSFLKRMGMLSLGKHLGIPRVFLRLAGGYGDRVSASTIRRRQLKSNTKARASSQANSGVASRHSSL